MLSTTNWLTYFIALVWIINGLFCKVLNLVPRHQQIVERILGYSHPRLITVLIGLAEICMAVWILSRRHKRLNVVTQLIAIAGMNILEFLVAPDLLLWGKGNAFFAFLFMLVIYYNQFHINKKLTQQSVCSHS